MSLSGSTSGDPLDVLIIGGGQAGLAVGYYLRRTGMSFAILDAGEGPGGAWRCGWDSLHAFSPARYSSLPGRVMPGGPDKYPTRDEVVGYLADYEERYGLLVHRPVRVEAVERRGEVLAAKIGHTWVKARVVVSATGTWTRPYVPDYPGRERFRGEHVHSAFYRSPEPYAGKRVLVVGGGCCGLCVPSSDLSRKERYGPTATRSRSMRLSGARASGRHSTISSLSASSVPTVGWTWKAPVRRRSSDSGSSATATGRGSLLPRLWESDGVHVRP